MPISKRALEYSLGDTTFQGELALADTASESARKPGILVVHEGGGLNDHPKYRAQLLAEMGYVAFACDMYGGGGFLTDPKARGERMTKLREDTTELRKRAQAGLAALVAQPEVDPQRLAAIGFCFGGLTVLELARSGAEVKGVVSFHGIYATKAFATPGGVKAKVLVLHGADDPFSNPAQISAFMDEMRNADVDWQFVSYGGAQHGYTRKDAAAVGMPGVVYHEPSERRAWAAMTAFLAELFA